MLSSWEKFFIVFVTALFFLGILTNGFIFLVNFIDCVKSKKLPSSDLILVSLAISRIGLSCVILWNSYLMLISFDVPNYLRITDIFLVLSHNSNMWFATILSIFYFLKITSFSNSLFLWMKWRIDRMVVKLLWVPFIISLLIIFPVMEKMLYYCSNLIRRTNDRNVSQEVKVSKRKCLMLQFLFGLFSLIPFTISIISLYLLIFSLWRHTRQMQVTATGSRDPSTEAHVRAMKAVSSFLILTLLYHTGFFANFWSHSEGRTKLVSMLNFSIMFLYPFGHSMILILWNSKLRKASLWVWQSALFCLREGKP